MTAHVDYVRRLTRAAAGAAAVAWRGLPCRAAAAGVSRRTRGAASEPVGSDRALISLLIGGNGQLSTWSIRAICWDPLVGGWPSYEPRSDTTLT